MKEREMFNRLFKLRNTIQEQDTSSLTIPKYVELHKKIQKILKEMDELIDFYEDRFIWMEFTNM